MGSAFQCTPDGRMVLCEDNSPECRNGRSWIVTHFPAAAEAASVPEEEQQGPRYVDTPCNRFHLYVACLHWSVMTITSIGYGDIVPTRYEEYYLSIFCML